MEELLKLLKQSRRQGSTTALLKASAEYNGIVVVHDMQYARELKRAAPLERNLTEKEIADFEWATTDIKKENFGLIDGKVVCVDYA